jgi:phosphoglycerate dehydrogenase-like enzyme
LLGRATEVFAKSSKPDDPPIDVKTLHAKVGQLTLENDFLKGALTKAGMLSEVAEFVVGLMIALSRQVTVVGRDMDAGHWARRMGTRIGESVIVLIGLGRIGGNVARLLSGFSPREVLF